MAVPGLDRPHPELGRHWGFHSTAPLTITLSPLASGQVGKELPGAGDVALYRAEVERIRAGELAGSPFGGQRPHQPGHPMRGQYGVGVTPTQPVLDPIED